MHSRKRALCGATTIGVVLGVAVSASASAATLNVGTCKANSYPTIGAAVAASSPGDTIKVCPGNYPEHVTVDFPLTFLGAQAGHDARHRNNPAKESVVDNQSGDFTLTGNANDVTIDGFTISDAGNGNSAGVYSHGVDAFAGSSGLTLVNNILADNQEGINFQNPDPNMPALLKHNAFVDNNVSDDGSGNSGTGAFISNGPANNTSITENSFTGDTQTAINFAGNPSSLSMGLVVKNNSSSDDSTFVVATNSDGAVVSDNKITVSAGFPNGSGILDFGNDTDLLIGSNTLSGGDAAGTSGIRVANFGGASTNTQVTNNKVTGRYNGIRVTAGTGGSISGNQVSKSSNDGILDDGGTGNLFSHNAVMMSAVHDCEDDTTGSGTAGTANTWQMNVGKSNNSLPAAICPRH